MLGDRARARGRVRGPVRARALPRSRWSGMPPRSAGCASPTRASAADPIDLPMDLLFGKAPRMQRDARRRASGLAAPAAPAGRVDLRDDLLRVLRHPSVGSKTLLVTIGDRTVGGLCARDQMVGPWQVPVADCAVTLLDFDGDAGEAMALGERTPLALIDAGRVGAHGGGRGDDQPRRGAGGFAGRSQAVGQLDGRGWRTRARTRRCTTRCARSAWSCARRWASRIPVGKDSLSMQAQWQAGGRERRGRLAGVADRHRVRARSPTCGAQLTPMLRSTKARASCADRPRRRPQPPRRLGPGAVHPRPARRQRAGRRRRRRTCKAFFEAIQVRNLRGLLLAYHDRSDGGAIVALLRDGVRARIAASTCCSTAGATMRSPRCSPRNWARWCRCATPIVPRCATCVDRHGLGPTARTRRPAARAATTVRLRAGRPRARHLSAAARAVRRLVARPAMRCSGCATIPTAPTRNARRCARLRRPGPRAAADLRSGARRRRAVHRHRRAPAGRDPARAGRQRPGRDGGRLRPVPASTPIDVHMSDLIEGRARLADFTGLAACGGFSYGDVLGAGRGWADLDPAIAPRCASSSRASSPTARQLRARRLQRLPDAGRSSRT